jgi:hypothetical protein
MLVTPSEAGIRIGLGGVKYLMVEVSISESEIKLNEYTDFCLH